MDEVSTLSNKLITDFADKKLRKTAGLARVTWGTFTLPAKFLRAWEINQLPQHQSSFVLEPGDYYSLRNKLLSPVDMETVHMTFHSTEGNVPRGITFMAESLRCDAES